ncbi:MAG: hypothetical protein M0Q16_03780 [Candidatus Cloacimonetes bacterium]|jgi:hypothetical protein|nr:hypothetical protein [Candidatus Cloacimonadota bacterium]MCK9184474.1 hypothetical protein [Candidatus Cloacimonadota bacterium]MCK9583355.1 hypothetical protein [Candidatus Cloacimonadota bacterium]
MKRSTARLLPYLTIFSLTLLSAIFSSCNLREDLLLPPNLDPKEYVVASQILVYSDHLIPSSNDNSYLYLPKSSIADSLIWYGDIVTLSRVPSLLQRDSLAVPSGSYPIGNSYRVEILREGQSIIIENAPALFSLYTDTESVFIESPLYLLSLKQSLSASLAKHYNYGKQRACYELDGSGDFAVLQLSGAMKLDVPANNSDIQGLLFGADIHMQVFIPAGFTQDLGAATISLNNPQEPFSDPADLLAAQELYPDFALLTTPLTITTEREGSSESTPILYYRMPGSRGWDTQWVKLSPNQIQSWPEAEDTWLIEDNTLISFINGAGTYFLLQPLASQNTIRISLDSPNRQIFLQDMWLDLRELNLPGIDLVIDPNPSYNELLQDYFGGKPYTLSGSSQAYRLSFYRGSELLDSLPDDKWLEFGFASSLPEPQKARLMCAFRNPQQDILSYKSHASAYDANHFTSADGYVYTGINSSGLYLLGNITESSSSLHVPCLKDKLFLQTQKTSVSYEDTKLPCTALRLEYKANVTSSHPWLNSLPYTLQQNQALLSISPIGSVSDALPKELFIETTVNQSLNSVINFSPQASYPKFVRYNKSNTLEHNSFLQTNSRLSISPAYAGYLIDGNNLQKPSTSRNLAMYPRMMFDDYDLELYLDSSALMPASTLQISRSGSLSDPYNVLDEQYQLSYLSPAYKFEMLNNADFYADFQPYIRIKHPSRSQDLLFSVSNQEHYRIYSYPEGDTADGWHFMNRDGHYAFYLPYDAEYAVLRDNDPHTLSELTITTAQDIHISLYQAQASFQGDFIGSSIPLGAKLSLAKLSLVAPEISFRAAYRLSLLGPQQNPLQPNFFSQINDDWPYLYIPIPDYTAAEPVRMFYRNAQGNTQELTRVSSFSDSPDDEFIMIGNCAIAFINNPGIFYVQ